MVGKKNKKQLRLMETGSNARKNARLKIGEALKATRGNPTYSLLADEDIDTIPPAGHLLRLGQQIVTHPAGDGDNGHGLENEVLLPADAAQHMDHLVLDLLVASLAVLGNIAILLKE